MLASVRAPPGPVPCAVAPYGPDNLSDSAPSQRLCSGTFGPENLWPVSDVLPHIARIKVELCLELAEALAALFLVSVTNERLDWPAIC